MDSGFSWTNEEEYHDAVNERDMLYEGIERALIVIREMVDAEPSNGKACGFCHREIGYGDEPLVDHAENCQITLAEAWLNDYDPKPAEAQPIQADNKLSMDDIPFFDKGWSSAPTADEETPND